MLKKRIIPLQLLKQGRLVKGRQFGEYRDVGDPVKSASVYNSQQADELVILNIEGEKGIAPLIALISELVKVCFMPLTLGGGITSLSDASALIAQGADKIFINTECYSNYPLISEIANRFGRQAVVCGIDVRFDHEANEYALFSKNGSRKEAVGLLTHIHKLQEAGAGELMIQSIDRDGEMQGYDLSLAKLVENNSTIPVLVAGGAGNYESLKALFMGVNVSAAVCGSLFNFTDSNPMRARSFLLNYGLPFKNI